MIVAASMLNYAGVNDPRLIFWLLESAFQASVIPERRKKELENCPSKALN